jgi:hypothetical protein
VHRSATANRRLVHRLCASIQQLLDCIQIALTHCLEESGRRVGGVCVLVDLEEALKYIPKLNTKPTVIQFIYKLMQELVELGQQ